MLESDRSPRLPNAEPRAGPVASSVSTGRHVLRTVIVSDVRLFRDGLALALASREGIVVIGTCDSIEYVLPWLVEMPDIVVLLDTGMPNALRSTHDLIAVMPATVVVGIAVCEDVNDVVACGEAGMAGYLAREASIEDVVATMHGVVRGELRFSPQMTSTLFRRLAQIPPRLVTGES